MKRLLQGALALTFVFTLSACGVQPATVDPAASAENAPDATAPDGATDAGTLVVYSGRSENLVGPLIEQFAEATGINVDVRYGSTAEITAALLEEGANSPADVFFAQDPGGIGAVANEGLLAPLPAEITGVVKEHFRSPENLWVGIAGRARVIVFNTEMLTPENLPEDIAEFTDPAWSGRIGLAPTNASFQVMVTAMREIWGEEGTRAWLEGIVANAPVIYEGNGPVVEGVASGEVEVGFVNHYYLYQFLAERGEGFSAANYFLPSGGPGSLVMVAGAGRLAGGQNEANALSFLEFLVSPAAQEYFTTTTNEYPVIEGVAQPEGLVPLEELNAPAIDLTALTDVQGTAVLLREVGLLQ